MEGEKPALGVDESTVILFSVHKILNASGCPNFCWEKRHLLSPYHFQEAELEKLQLDIDK